MLMASIIPPALLAQTTDRSDYPRATTTSDSPRRIAQAATSTTSQAPASAAPEEEATIVLSPFEVSSVRDTGYTATQSLAGTRIRTDLKDIGNAVSVITQQFMQDIGATGSDTLLQYTTNAEVAGTRGTFAGLGNGTTLDESSNLRAPAGAQRVRGLAAADNTRDYYITDIPWDSFNVDRVDILRGPNSFLFGLGSPAGIVNASIKSAEFRNRYEGEVRTGSYGSLRTRFDLNQQLIPSVLAIRLSGLADDQRYEQKQAYQDQRRGSIAVRFDPQLFNTHSAHTSIRFKAEHGTISADRPRILPPLDSITPWWDSTVNREYVKASRVTSSDPANTGNIFQLGTNLTSTTLPGGNFWLSGAGTNQQQPVWFQDGTSGQLYQIYGGFVNTGALNTNGAPQSASASLVGQAFSGLFTALGGYNGWANAYHNSSLYNASTAPVNVVYSAQTRDRSLTDSSVYDFYTNLIDGPTKHEYEKWNAYNIDLTQTFWDERLGVDLTYDRQFYMRGGQQLLGNPTLNIDIDKQFQDFSTNPNFGRPFVSGGPGGGSSYRSERKVQRASLFGELRPDDFLQNNFLRKLFGKQRLNGIYAKEDFYNEALSWQMYAHSQAWDGYWNQTTGQTDGLGNRAPQTFIYLGGSLANLSSPSGAGIPGITAPITLSSGNIYHFSSTWKNPPNVTYSAAWTVPTNLLPMYGYYTDPAAAGAPATPALTQVSNPANYVGWNSNFYDQLSAYNWGQDQSLTTRAQKALRETKSYAASYQGYFWNEAFVATLGWRYDEVSTRDVTAKPVANARATLDLAPQDYALPKQPLPTNIKKGHSTSENFVLHVNKLLPKDPLPIDISFTFANSSNFAVSNVRRDIYGNSLPDPTGSTRDYGIWLSTKDGKWSFRAVKYTTYNKQNDTGLSGIAGALGSFVQQGMRWRNVFLYQLGAYTLASANQPQGRNTWTNLYPNETAAQAQAEEDAAITAWNNIQKWLAPKGFFQAWNFTPTGPDSALVDRTTYLSDPAKYAPDTTTVAQYIASAPQGFSVTADTVSRGYEFELTANPTPNWRIAFNASETEAVRTNFGGPALDEFMAYMQSQMVDSSGTILPAGKLSQFGNSAQFSLYQNQWAPLYAQYQLVKAQQGATVPELRKWRFNVITNYSFTHGFLRGVGIGAGYRWQDKIGIGYPVLSTGLFDISKPYYGPSEGAADLWASYERKISNKIHWKIQFNVTNVGQSDGLIPLTVEPDGTVAVARIKPVQEWFLTNTFTF